jgi:hypothetical protein
MPPTEGLGFLKPGRFSRLDSATKKLFTSRLVAPLLGLGLVVRPCTIAPHVLAFIHDRSAGLDGFASRRGTGSFNGNFASASFTQELSRYEEAEIAYDRCIECALKCGMNAECRLERKVPNAIQ